MDELKVVGKSVPRVDALDKVTGGAKYCSDFKVPGMLHGKILRSSYPHARIVSIDTSKAEKLPGVRAVVTGKDVRPVRCGSNFYDEYLLPCDNLVRAVGQPVAEVAADTAAIAEEALDLVEVIYEELPAVFDVEEALKENPLVVIHPDLAEYKYSGAFYNIRLVTNRPNVLHHFKIRNGDVEKGFREADIVVENRYTTARVQHCQLETHCAIAWWECDGSLVIRTGTQGVFRDAAAARMIFNLPTSKVRVLASYVGGGFGGKMYSLVGPLAALLARKSKRPVRLAYSRQEQFIDGRHRPRFVIYIKDGVKRDGTLIAREMRVILDMGRHSGTGAIIIKNCAFGAVGTYRLPNFKFDSYGVYTNNPITGPYRGLGTAEVLWAIEQQMDILAERLKMSPLEIRRVNILREGEKDACGQVTHAIGVRGCLDKVAEEMERWDEEVKKDGHWRRGRGIAIGNKYTIAGSSSSAIVKVYPDGTIEVRHGNSELGQGLNTVIAQIAAEEFGISTDQVKVVYGDTALGAYDLAAVSSRSTFHTGNAVQRACQDAKRQMFEIAAGKLGVNAAGLVVKGGKVFVENYSAKLVEISSLFTAEGIALKKGEIIGEDYFYSPIILEDPETGQSERMVTSYTHGAFGVELAVNEETGEIGIQKIASCFDMGQPINPKMSEGQIEGGYVQGVGVTLYEAVAMSDGRVENSNLADYKIPTTMDLPDLENVKCMIAGVPHNEGPFGAKGLGEATMIPISPAIANAVYDAVGVRIMDMPISKEKVLWTLGEESSHTNKGTPSQ